MKSLKREEVTERAQQAKRLLDNDDFSAIIDNIKSDIFDQFCGTNVLDAERREEIHKVSYAVDLLRKKIEAYIAAEKLASIAENQPQ
ncbi:hypothetical protein EXN32_21935 [Agrobacterium tumefaciens]|uniref:hypothetical protein n=1 Tax=Agrobacterium TaxID=357 RepID=UPI00115D6D88|nr:MULTISPECIES: hypothetical protein [Agrobacterium]MDA5241139.1 hypothetical protein [Agrobacterium sp. MAFF310724]MDA5249570.1 hypothetical protein [Agrobacterium sp. MAFF210268]TRB12367.1 hypothetical protein EXN32_21935 [Agrobacterium tumefaciens]